MVTNGKRRFHSFMEFYVMHIKKIRGFKFDHSTTLSLSECNKIDQGECDVFHLSPG